MLNLPVPTPPSVSNGDQVARAGIGHGGTETAGGRARPPTSTPSIAEDQPRPEAPAAAPGRQSNPGSRRPTPDPTRRLPAARQQPREISPSSRPPTSTGYLPPLGGAVAGGPFETGHPAQCGRQTVISPIGGC